MSHALNRPSYQNQERIISFVAQCMLTGFTFKRKQDELSVYSDFFSVKPV